MLQIRLASPYCHNSTICHLLKCRWQQQTIGTMPPVAGTGNVAANACYRQHR
jgi:hypothetical protein